MRSHEMMDVEMTTMVQKKDDTDIFIYDSTTKVHSAL